MESYNIKKGKQRLETPEPRITEWLYIGVCVHVHVYAHMCMCVHVCIWYLHRDKLPLGFLIAGKPCQGSFQLGAHWGQV